jgi:hypothetical protein
MAQQIAVHGHQCLPLVSDLCLTTDCHNSLQAWQFAVPLGKASRFARMGNLILVISTRR